MDRRHFMLSLFAATTATTSVAQAASLYASRSTVGLADHDILRVTQKCENWCWAACGASIFATHGYKIDQESLVTKLYGAADMCAIANGPEIRAAITGPWRDRRGQNFSAQADIVMDRDAGVTHPDPLAEMAQELMAGRPMIVGTLGHAMVITAMTFSRGRDFRLQAHEIRVFDPWQTAEGIRPMTQDEQVNARYLSKVSLKRA